MRSIKYLAAEFGCDEKTLKKFISQYFNIEPDKKHFRSIELDALLKGLDDRRKQASEAGKASGSKRRETAKAKKEPKTNEQPFNNRSTTVQQPFNESSTDVKHNTIHNKTIQENTEHNNINISQENTAEIEEKKYDDSPEIFINNSNPSDESFSSNINNTSVKLNNSNISDNKETTEESIIRIKNNLLKAKESQNPDYDAIEIWESLLKNLSNPSNDSL